MSGHAAHHAAGYRHRFQTANGSGQASRTSGHRGPNSSSAMDEVSAQGVSVQALLLDLMRDLQRAFDLTHLFMSQCLTTFTSCDMSPTGRPRCISDRLSELKEWPFLRDNAEAGSLAGRRAGLPCVLPRPCRTTLLAEWGTQRMFDAANARRLMVEGQVRTADVTDTDLLDAMQTLPRERFLPPALAPAGLSGRRYSARQRPRAAQADGARQAHSGGAGRPRRIGSSMWAVRLAIRRPCWRALAGSVVALEEDADLARQAKEALAAVGAAACRGRHRAVDGGLAGGRALRRDFPRWRDRNRARRAWPAAEAGRPLGRRLRPLRRRPRR